MVRLNASNNRWENDVRFRPYDLKGFFENISRVTRQLVLIKMILPVRIILPTFQM
jgi:hypothetical protein